MNIDVFVDVKTFGIHCLSYMMAVYGSPAGNPPHNADRPPLFELAAGEKVVPTGLFLEDLY